MTQTEKRLKRKKRNYKRKKRDIYKITLTRGEREYSFNFGQSINGSGVIKEIPTAYDVLSCLTDYDPETFKEFCDNFGYDNDSRKAETIYKAVVEEYKNVCMLWNQSELEQLQEIN